MSSEESFPRFEVPARATLYGHVKTLFSRWLAEFEQGFETRNGRPIKPDDPSNIVFFEDTRQPLLLPGFGSDEVSCSSAYRSRTQSDGPFKISEDFLIINCGFFADRSPYVREVDDEGHQGVTYNLVIPAEPEAPPFIVEDGHPLEPPLLRSAEHWAAIPKYFLSDQECTAFEEVLRDQVLSAEWDDLFFNKQ